MFVGQKQERNQIAGQLHDNLGGYLSAIKYNLMALDSDNLNEKERKIFDNMKNMVVTAYDEVRYLSHNIMPKDLENKGIIFCLQKIAKQLNDTGKIAFSYEGVNMMKIDLKTEYELYSVCLELTNNILKHSNASQGGILINKEAKAYNIFIYDNGIGIKETSKGFGIENISIRLRKINGEISFSEVLPNSKDYFTTIFKIII
jgi:two-component system, NarL family, sensor histidine kinase LiaS